MHITDRVTGLFLIGLGCGAWYGGALLPPVPGQQVGPNVFPIVVGAGLVICGAMIALGVGSAIEKEAEAELAAHTDAAMSVGSSDSSLIFALKTLLPPALLLFYVAAVERLGFIPVAAIIVLLTSLAMGARLKLAIPLALFASLGVHLIFLKLLRVPLPPGLLPMPW
jgi:putative tricarboxylic transport membrane protein